MFRTLPPLSRGIIIALIVSALLSLALSSFVVVAIPLYAALLLQKFQIWRLVSYPFFVAASMRGLLPVIFTLVWNGFLIAMFGGELETIVHTKRLTIALTGSIIVGGLIFSVLSPQGALAGPGIIIMFFLAGFAYLWPKREISVFGIFWVKAWVVALAVFLISIISFDHIGLDTSASNLFGPVFGSLAALLYFHAVYRQYRFGKGLLDRAEELFTRPSNRKRFRDVSTNPKIVEEQIDLILDKIASKGMQSLSKEEKEFLLRHSK